MKISFSPWFSSEWISYFLPTFDPLPNIDWMMSWISSFQFRWADKECKRQQLPLTMESKRLVLGDSLFLPRYLTMTLATFGCDLGPAKSGLLTPEEVETLTRILKDGTNSKIQALSPVDSSPQNNPLGIPPSLRPYYRVIARPRCPIRAVGGVSPAKKAKRGSGLNIIERWNHRRCCRSRRGNNNNNRSRSSSQYSTPTNSNPSSPSRNFGSVQQPKKWNLCVERVVIFLACLFDWWRMDNANCNGFVIILPFVT